MCGIFGLITIKKQPHDFYINKAKRALDLLSNRGPDSSGYWLDHKDGIVIGHTRLEIIGLGKQGEQPMISSSGRYVITFNGEIYNYQDLRKIIPEKKEVYLSDTQILLENFEKFGIDKTLERLEGMFSMGIWDKKIKNLFLIRDRFGEKPLYYELTKDYIIFSSEINVITSNFVKKRTINKSAINSLLSFGYVSDKISIYDEISKIQPSTINVIKRKKEILDFKTSKYWEKEFKSNYNSPGINLKKNNISYLDNMEQIIYQSILDVSKADVEVGLFLSGGVDSSYLATQLCKIKSNKRLKTFSMGFEQAEYDETFYSDIISKKLNTDHHKFIFRSKEVLPLVENLDKVYKEPFADISAIPTILLSKKTSQYMKVAIGGDGADEVFGGYQRYLRIFEEWQKIKKIPKELRNFIAKVSGKFLTIKKIDISNLETYYQYRNSCWKLDKNIIIGFNNTQNNDFDIKNEIFCLLDHDQKNYLPGNIFTKTDRASMHYGLEIRSPFIHHRIFEELNSLPKNLIMKKNVSKYILKELLYKELPKELFIREKKGFGAPLDYWLRNELKDWANDLLNPDLIERQGFFDKNIVSKVWQNHLQKRSNKQYYLWPILMFQQWLSNQ